MARRGSTGEEAYVRGGVGGRRQAKPLHRASSIGKLKSICKPRAEPAGEDWLTPCSVLCGGKDGQSALRIAASSRKPALRIGALRSQPSEVELSELELSEASSQNRSSQKPAHRSGDLRSGASTQTWVKTHRTAP
eukprot:361222-Chlamydomonas_euryale.AAC.4